MAERILAIMPQDLPGIVMTEPALRALKENLPKAQILAATSHHWAPLIQHCPHIDDILIYQPFSPFTPIKFWKRSCYRGILFDSSFLNVLWLKLSGIKKRVGFRNFGSTQLINRRVQKMPEIYRHIRVRHMVELVRFFGCQVDGRVPDWGRYGDSQGTILFCNQGQKERLPSTCQQQWEAYGCETLNLSSPVEELYKKICAAKMMVGPPDSLVTLAQALGVPSIRLSQGATRQDEFPGQHSLVVSPQLSPQLALEKFASFQ